MNGNNGVDFGGGLGSSGDCCCNGGGCDFVVDATAVDASVVDVIVGDATVVEDVNVGEVL